MSDMQKVRVSLTDADGKVHEVVGYCYSGYAGNGIHGINVEEAHDEVNPWYIEIDETLTPFAVIQELPTGLGAVVEVAPHGEQFVHVGQGPWSNHESEMISEDIQQIPFTVLSEGVK